MKSSASKKLKLLVVDDEPDNLDLLYRTFHRDYKVLRADNGLKALTILEQDPDIAAIISDQRMPEMSGTEFLSLTAIQYPDIMRIILTGYTDVEDLVDAINAGQVFRYVTKPWDADDLKAVVAQAVETHVVLKSRTEELRRALRQESLVNTVTSTIRSALDYQELLQTIVNSVGRMLAVSCCILRPVQEGQLLDEWFIHTSSDGHVEGLGAAKGDGTRSQAPYCAIDNTQMAQTLWEVGEVEVIEDIETHEPFQEDAAEVQARLALYRQAGIRSSLVVPLLNRQELVAVLALHQCGEPRAWQDDEVQLVVMVADQAALALAQSRAYEQVRTLAQREVLINAITSAIRSSLDPQEIFAAIAEQLGRALQVDGCALSLWTVEDEFVRCAALHVQESELGTRFVQYPTPNFLHDWELLAPENRDRTDPSTLPESQVPIANNPVLQQLIATQEPVAIADLDKHPELSGADLPFEVRARALLLVPMVNEGQIIGSISLRQLHQPRQWRPSEIALIHAVAVQAAIAVQQSRLYQKTRQQAERLMEIDRQKNEFFQNISHEFRTPLTLMIGPLESAASQQEGLSTEQTEIALRNSRRLLRLVNQLLDLQRLDAQRMQPTFCPTQFDAFVGQIVETFRPYCEKKQLRLSVDLQPCPTVYLDGERFDKVIYNLLSNAMKFTPAGGHVTVIVEPHDGRCLLRVRDTGVGIQQTQLPHLFERFRQAEGSVNRSYEGSGLGLALVKELVDLHRGEVTVVSTVGEGTSFSVYLQPGTDHLPAEQLSDQPIDLEASRATIELADVQAEGSDGGIIASPNSQAAIAPSLSLANSLQQLSDAIPNSTTPSNANEDIAVAGSTPQPSTILMVDDNRDLRAYVGGILAQQGYQVLTARNGAEGFQVAAAQQPDLIVTDLMMPGVSGLDLIRAVREAEAIQGTPIVLLTAKVDENTRVEGVEQGADAYLSKPFNDRELLAEVRNLLALKATERRVQALNRYLTESVLKRFLPPSLVKRAAAGQLTLDLRPEPRLVTILFSDIVGFTQISNTLRSRRVAQLLNEYLEVMSEAIFATGGTVDKFMGDAVLALFGAPEELSPNEQVRRAIAAARKMRLQLDQLNHQWQERGLVGADGRTGCVQFRCGIHQGPAVVGMFGSAERADYTAIGPSVNIASRLQEAAEPNTILVSAAVADYLDEDDIIKCSPLRLKGIDETVLTFALKLEAAANELPLSQQT